MGQYVMGLDNGGTSTKAAIFDLQGREIATAGKQTSMITPKSGYTERDMEELWLANCDCIKSPGKSRDRREGCSGHCCVRTRQGAVSLGKGREAGL